MHCATTTVLLHPPYNVQDFYHPLPPGDRPQVLGLTASPEGMEQDRRKRKQRAVHMGLQYNMNAWLITVPEKGPLRSAVKQCCWLLLLDVAAAGGLIHHEC